MHHSPPTSRRMRLFSRCAWATAAFKSAAGSRDSSYPAGGSFDEPPAASAAPAVAARVKSMAESSTRRILVRFIANLLERWLVSQQVSLRAVAGVRPCEKKGPFPHVAGKRGRSLEFCTRLGQPAGPEQKVAPRRRQGRIVAEGVVVDLVHQSE